MKILDSIPTQANIMLKNKQPLEKVYSVSDSEEDESNSDGTSTDNSIKSDHKNKKLLNSLKTNRHSTLELLTVIFNCFDAKVVFLCFWRM